MPQFMGHYLNRLDAKGRVSIPAPFRTVLRGPASGAAGAMGPVALVVRPSHMHDCLEGWSVEEFDRVAERLSAVPLFSKAHDDLATSIYGDAWQLESDREGRIVLPEALATEAGLNAGVTFIGLGRYFQIWEPGAAEQRRSEAKQRARSEGLTVPGEAIATAQQFVGTPRA